MPFKFLIASMLRSDDKLNRNLSVPGGTVGVRIGNTL